MCLIAHALQSLVSLRRGRSAGVELPEVLFIFSAKPIRGIFKSNDLKRRQQHLLDQCLRQLKLSPILLLHLIIVCYRRAATSRTQSRPLYRLWCVFKISVILSGCLIKLIKEANGYFPCKCAISNPSIRTGKCSMPKI